MPKAALVKRGEEYLPGIQLSELEEAYRREPPGKSRDRLQAAGLRKRGRALGMIARIMGRSVSTVHRWLSRMGREGLDGRHDGKSPGRPRLLNPEQEKAIEGDLDGTPRESGFERGSWNARMVARRILDRFGVPYSDRSAIRLAHRLGFSIRKPPIRPVQQRHAGGADGVHQEGSGDRRQMEGRGAGPSWLSTRLPCATRRYRAGGSGVGEEGRRCPSTTPSSPST